MSNKRSSSFYLKIFWLLIAIPLVSITAIFIFISMGWLGFMPSFEDLENPQKNIASEIISEDDEIIGTYYYENRTFVRYDQISPNMINALVATEDIRYFKHSGIDFRGLARVFFKTLLLQGNSGGGSTITQQLAKNLFPRDTTHYNFFLSRKANLVINKFKEWQTAVKLERNYTKEEIMVMYLNTVPFGHQAFGIKMAAKTFFKKSPDSLKIEEAAVLVGILKAPTRYSPVINPERSLSRRNVVLEQMARNKYITQRELDSLSVLPIKLNFLLQDHSEGLGTYLREYLRILLTSNMPDPDNYYAFEDYKHDSIEWATNPLYGWCNKHFKPDGSPYNIYKDGLKIYTTINARMQRYAEEAVKQHLKGELQPALFAEKKGAKNAPFASKLDDDQIKLFLELSIKRTERYRVMRNAGYSWNDIQKAFKKKEKMRVFTYNGDRDTVLTPMDSMKYYKSFLQSGFIALDPHNGNVKAYVGGIDFKHFKYDHVTQSKRQAGSTIKPFIYTLAMQEGYSPCRQVLNVPITFLVGDTTWTPKDDHPDLVGRKISLTLGLAESLNYIAAWVMKQFNPSSVIEIMRKMGIKSNIAAVPSLVLGTSDVTLCELVDAYSCYANKGISNSPVFTTRIEDRNGNIISVFKSEKTEAISDQTAYLMLKMLEVSVSRGTSVRLHYKYNFTTPIAGKTGTTQNQSDGLFIGITHDLVAGAWVGAEDRSVHFESLAMGQGASMALPIWALFFQKVYADKTLHLSAEPFEKPSNFNYNLDCDDIGNQQLNEQDYQKIEMEGF